MHRWPVARPSCRAGAAGSASRSRSGSPQDGANVALIAKTAEPHPKLPGTVFTAAEEIEEAGGQALPIVGDVRDEDQVADAVAQTAEKFGGVDIVVNNASAINLAPMAHLEVKRFDLMQSINSRGTFVLTKAALAHLRESDHAHVLTLSPPLSADPKWLKGNSAYTLSKMGMTMLTLGLAAGRGRERGRRQLPLAAHDHRDGGGPEPAGRRRGDGSRARPRRSTRTRRTRSSSATRASAPATPTSTTRSWPRTGVTDFSRYSAPGAELALDLFVDEWGPSAPQP